MTDTLTHQLAISAVLVWILEQLKRWPAFRWVHADSDAVNRAVSIGFAFVAAVGMQISMSGSIHAGGTLVITWPSMAQMGDAASRFVSQYVMQELVYRGAVKRAPKLPDLMLIADRLPAGPLAEQASANGK